MFKYNPDSEVLSVELPQGMTMEEINAVAERELSALVSQMHGRSVKVNGRCTTALAMLLGHILAHVCKSLWIYDPKEASYVCVVKH